MAQHSLTGSLDGEDARTYFQRIGGEEVFERIFRPGLNGPVGGSVETSSRVILMQVIWNLLVRGNGRSRLVSIEFQNDRFPCAVS